MMALRADCGPGIECLEYLKLSNGHPLPADVRSHDLCHWQTRLIAPALPAIEQALRRDHAQFVSSGVIGLPLGQLGFHQGVLVRDPDGHALQVLSP